MQKEEIIAVATRVFARQGYDGLSMRTLAKEMNWSLSALYYYYPGKDDLLKDMFNTVNTQLGIERSLLAPEATIEGMFKQRIAFQFEYAEQIVASLKYYMHFREQFEKNELGYLPPKAHLHIEEVLTEGVRRGELQVENIDKESKFVTHMINGFVLEYFPDIPPRAELDDLVSDITSFVLRSFNQ